MLSWNLFRSKKTNENDQEMSQLFITTCKLCSYNLSFFIALGHDDWFSLLRILQSSKTLPAVPAIINLLVEFYSDMFLFVWI